MASPFPTRKIGTTPVSAIGVGCMSFSIPLSTGIPSEATSFAALTAAADMGINLWVTNDMYGPFHNETLLGRWFAETGRRDEIFLVSKFGIKIGDEKIASVDGSPEHVKSACEASLKRLNTSYIDLYMPHRIDGNTPIENTVEAMVQLKNEGQIRYLGMSECSTNTLKRAHKVHDIAAVEMEYSPFALEIEDPEVGFLEATRERGVKIIAYSPLGRGFLTGAIKSREDFDEKDRRKEFPRFSEENFGGNLKLVEGMEGIAKKKGCTPSQLTLAWILAQGDDFIPIPGTKRVDILKQNADAVHVQLSEEEEKHIREMIRAPATQRSLPRIVWGVHQSWMRIEERTKPYASAATASLGCVLAEMFSPITLNDVLAPYITSRDSQYNRADMPIDDLDNLPVSQIRIRENCAS